jgi:nucleoside 2-deoxyribosyltransferase
MKVYVAGSYQYRLEVDRLVDKIQQAIPDFECTSTWIRQGEEDDLLKEKGHQHFIDLDRQDIGRADVFLLINEFKMSKHSTGKWVELGIAMELGLQIVVWGNLQDSLFIHGTDTIIIEETDEPALIKALTNINKIMRKMERDVYDAYRTVGGGEAGGSRLGVTPGVPEDRGEIFSHGVRSGEGRSLHDFDRASENRTQGLGRAQIRAGEATPPHPPATTELKS